ncbi:MAG: TonB-dependent receptor domain-containing protein [Caulobacteraceae bacterium]
MARLCGSALAAGSALAIAPAALAAGSPDYDFHIPPKSLSEALIDFAVQSNLSIGGVSACAGRSEGLAGRHTVDQALRMLLDGSNCRFRRVASDTVRILPLERAPPASPTPGPAPTALPPPAPEPMPMLQEVVVNATKRAAVVDQLPYAVSALDAEALQTAGAVDVDDVASQLASFSTTNLGPGRNKILLRGLSDGVFTGRTQSTVGVYLDDVPITYNAPDPDLHIGDLDMVEVLRGPQGTLYGGGSMSGIYRIVTRKPELDEVSGAFRGGMAETQGGGLSNQVEGIVNAPLVKDRLAIRAMAYQDVEGGYIDDINLHQAQIDRSVRTGGRAYLRGDIDPSLTITLGGAYQEIHSNDTQYISPNLGRLHRANLVREASDNNFGHAEAVIEKIGSWGVFRSTTSFVRHDFSSRADATNALPLFSTTATGVGSYDEPSKIDMLVEDAVWTSPGSGRLQWLAGVFGSVTQEQTDSFVRATDVTGAATQLLYQEHRGDNLSEAAAYGEATWSFTDNLQATVGARAFLTRVGTHSTVQDPQSGDQRLFKGAVQSSGVSPKVALSYRLADQQLLYVSIAEGHRSGGFNTGGRLGAVFVPDSNQPGVHRQFSGDELWNFEIGAKLTLLGGRLRLRAAGFYDIWTNIQTDQFLLSGLSYTANAGNGRDIGFESEATIRLTPSWTLQANVLIDQPVLQHAFVGFMPGVNLPGVPDVLAGGRTEYRFALPYGMEGLVAADARYVGRSQLTFNPFIQAPMGGYVLGRLSAQVSYGRWRLAAFMSNPTNETGNTFSYGNPFNFQQVREVTPQRPRSLRLLLSAEF